jgi:hypothetical protein
MLWRHLLAENDAVTMEGPRVGSFYEPMTDETTWVVTGLVV